MNKIWRAAAAGWCVALANTAWAQEARAVWPQEPASVFGIPIGGVLQDDAVRDCGQLPDPSQQDSVLACALRKRGPGLGMLLSKFPIPSLGDGFLERRDFVVKSLLLTALHTNYQDVRAVLIARYGPPTSSGMEVLQDEAGSKFSSEVLRWQGQRVALTLREHKGEALLCTAIFTALSQEAAVAPLHGPAAHGAAAQF